MSKDREGCVRVVRRTAALHGQNPPPVARKKHARRSKCACCHDWQAMPRHHVELVATRDIARRRLAVVKRTGYADSDMLLYILKQCQFV